MPQGDGTGPYGLGGCGIPWFRRPLARYRGRGLGLARGWGRGFFRRRVFYPPARAPAPITRDEEIALLEEEASLLEEQLEEIGKRIKELRQE